MDQLPVAAEALAGALKAMREARSEVGRSELAREISIAITHTEDAQLRIERLLFLDGGARAVTGLSFPGSKLADEAHAGETQEPRA